MPGPLAKYRLLMFGSDDVLLQVRSRVLSTIGCETRVVCQLEEARQALASSDAKPMLVVICHTAEQAPAEELRKIALREGVPTYYVETLLPPKHLVSDVCAILKPEGQPIRAANASSPRK